MLYHNFLLALLPFSFWTELVQLIHHRLPTIWGATETHIPLHWSFTGSTPFHHLPPPPCHHTAPSYLHPYPYKTTKLSTNWLLSTSPDFCRSTASPIPSALHPLEYFPPPRHASAPWVLKLWAAQLPDSGTTSYYTLNRQTPQFKSKLKTYLFRLAYSLWLHWFSCVFNSVCLSLSITIIFITFYLSCLFYVSGFPVFIKTPLIILLHFLSCSVSHNSKNTLCNNVKP